MIPQSHPAYPAVSPLLTPIQGESKNCPGLYRAPKRKGGFRMDKNVIVTTTLTQPSNAH